MYPQFDAVDWKNAANIGILCRNVSGSPASSKSIFQCDCSDNRLARTHPAGPEPTIMKSYSCSVGFLPEIETMRFKKFVLFPQFHQILNV